MLSIENDSKDNRQFRLDMHSRLKPRSHDVIRALRPAPQARTYPLLPADQQSNTLLSALAVKLSIMSTKADVGSGTGGVFTLPVACCAMLEVAALVLAWLVVMPGTMGCMNPLQIESIPDPCIFRSLTKPGEGNRLLPGQQTDSGVKSDWRQGECITC
jgi:hypothetical protein